MGQAKPIAPQRAAELLALILNNLPERSTVSLKRDEIELPPQNGWRRSKAGNMIFVEVFPPPLGAS